MPKKKGQSKQIPMDFTLDYYANAQKLITKVNKPTTTNPEEKSLTDNPSDVTWDQISDDEELDFVKEVNSDGTVNFACIKKRNKTLNNEYPEIIWHEISRRIHPEDISRFAVINKTTYSITQQKSFWVYVYDKYCKNSPELPERLRIENGAKPYGLKTRTVRALYNTYTPFVKKVKELGMHDSKPHELVRRRCVNMWFRRSKTHWALFFKFKKLSQQQTRTRTDLDFIDELGRLDANPELDNQVLQVNYEFFYEVPPNLLGMILTSIKVGLSKNLRSHKLYMGFNSGVHVAKNILPECSLTVDTVISTMVIDWWHPNYPHFVIRFPWENRDREREEDQDAPVLDQDFFAPCQEYQQANGSTRTEIVTQTRV